MMGVAVLQVGNETVLVEFSRIGLTSDVAGTDDTLLVAAFWDKLTLCLNLYLSFKKNQLLPVS